MKKLFVSLSVAMLWLAPAYAAINGFLGVSKALNDVQDKNGKADTNPISPAISFGRNFEITSEFGFSPQLGYIHNTINSDDSYGEYKMYTIFILYDVLWIPSGFESFAIRGGVGTFMKTIKGSGGTVQIPNGSGTATAYKASGSSTSYSSTINLGFDYNIGSFMDTFEMMGLRFETFVFRPFSSENRNYAFNLGGIFYF